MSIRNTLVSLVFVLVTAGVATDAGAQQGSEGPCAADAKKFCKGIAPGGGRILSCLKARQAELNPACAADIKRAGNRKPPAQ